MGKIPEFQRRKLASSVVGTPGLDISGTIIGQSVSSALDKITRSIISTVAAKKNILDEVDANKRIIDYEVEYEDALKGIRANSLSNPEQAIQQTVDLGNTLGNTFLDTIESNSVRNRVALLQQGVIRNETRAMSKWASAQQVINAGVDLTASINALTVRAEGTDDLKVVGKIIMKVQEINVVAERVLGKKSEQFIKDSQKSIASGFLHGQMDRNPIRAGRFLRQGVFNKILSDDERKKWRKDIDNAIAKKADTDRTNLLFDLSDKYIDLTKAYGEGTLKVSELDIVKLNMQDAGVPEEDLQFIDILRDTLLSSSIVTSVDNNEMIAKIADQWHNLGIDSKKGTAKGSAENIHKFLRFVADAHKRGIITKVIQDGFITKATPALLNKIQAELERKEGSFGEILAKRFKGDTFEAIDVGFTTIAGWARTHAPENADSVAGRLIKDYMTAVSIEEKQIGVQLTEERSREIAEQVIARETRKDFPGYKLENLQFTADETGMTLKQVFDLLEKNRLGKK